MFPGGYGTDVGQKFIKKIVKNHTFSRNFPEGEICLRSIVSWIWIRDRNHAILGKELHMMVGSSPWNHGLNGELCPEYCQSGLRIFLLFSDACFFSELLFLFSVCVLFLLIKKSMFIKNKSVDLCFLYLL